MRVAARLGWVVAGAVLLVPVGTASAQSSLWTHAVNSGTDFAITAVEYQSDDRLWYATEMGEIIRRVGDFPRTQLPATGIAFNDIDFQPGGDVGIAVGNSGTVYRTTDGATWNPVSGLQTLDHDCVGGQDTLEAVSGDLLSVTWADASTVYISGRERVVLRSTNAGATFAERNKQPNKKCRTLELVRDITDTVFSGSVGYLVSDGTGTPQTWRTADGLDTDVLPRARAVECGTRPRLALDPADVDRLWAVDRCSTAEAFRYSEDGGMTFATVGLPGNVQNGLNDVAVAPRTLIAVGNSGEILISKDGRTASRWPGAGTLGNHNWGAVDLADAAKGAIGGDGGVLLMTTLADTVPVPPGTPPGGPFPPSTSPGGGSQGGAPADSSSQGSAPAGGGGGGGVLGALRAKPGVTLRVRARRLGTGQLRLGVTGRLLPPPGVDRPAACHGRVSLTFRTRGRTIARRRVPVGRNCRFSTPIVGRAGTQLASAKRLRVGARFGGNRALLPAGSSVSTRVG
jgi:hypothetical protein